MPNDSRSNGALKITFRPVTPANRGELIALKVLPGQTDFIETVAQCLKDGESAPWQSLGIYIGDRPAGYAMYGFFAAESSGGRLWLDRFMLDGRYQGHGYGKLALAMLIDRLQDEFHSDKLYLSVFSDNPAAALYESFGFEKNGELDSGGEIIMVKTF